MAKKQEVICCAVDEYGIIYIKGKDAMAYFVNLKDETWTIPKLAEAADRAEVFERFYFSLQRPEILKDFDEHLFKKRPDIRLFLLPEKVNGHRDVIPYSKESLDAISNMQNLLHLTLRFKQAQDLGALSSSNLKSLGLDFLEKSRQPMSLAFVKNFPGLAELSLQNTPFAGLETIKELKNLRKLYIGNVTLDDLSFLEGAGLDHLILDTCRLDCDLSSICKAKLQKFETLSNHNLTNLDFISGLTSLRYLKISQAKAAFLPDFSSLTSLDELHLSGMKSLESISGIASAQSLKTLQLQELSAKIKAEDLRILLPLQNLDNLYIDYLDFGKARIKAVTGMFHEAGKGHILKNGMLV